jgi:dTDP-4-amino-4,6-dideoxygalactose transaminase
LKHIGKILNIHRSNADYYNSALECVPGVSLLKNQKDRSSVSWLFTMKVARRDDFIQYMGENGVMVSKVHARNDLHHCLKEFRTDLPNLEEFSKEMVSIPVGSHVSPDNRRNVSNLIKKGW